MHLRSKVLVVALVGLALFATSASAATVTYVLDLRVPGTFDLYADVSSGDNGGLLFFDAPLLGDVLSIDTLAPLTVNGNNFAQAGFGQLRSADSVGPVSNPEVRGGQDFLSAPAANRMYGIGQESSGFVAKGVTPAFQPDPTAALTWGAVPLPGYDNPVLLASGTLAVGSSLGFNLTSPDLVANVWNQVQGTDGPAAEVLTAIITSDVIIPEPATATLIGLALLGAFGFIRRR